LNPEDPVPAEASLTMFDPKGSEESKWIWIGNRYETWVVDEQAAKFWLDRIRMDIQDERTWVFRNGLIWDGVTIRPGDNCWIEGGSLDQPRHARLCLRDRPIVWWKNDPIRTERMSLFHAIHELNDLKLAYRRGEIEVRRNGVLWREELATEGSRWEIKKIEEYDPERLEAEGQILPLPPPLLGVKYYMWKNAPRAVPVNQDPLK
jgi:hypothetical protein